MELNSRASKFTSEQIMIKNFCEAFLREEDGQDLVEYALLLAFLGIAGTAALSSINSSIATIFGNIKTQMSTAATTSGS
jgi:Flp pilus assembly pilin Flp